MPVFLYFFIHCTNNTLFYGQFFLVMRLLVFRFTSGECVVPWEGLHGHPHGHLKQLAAQPLGLAQVSIGVPRILGERLECSWNGFIVINLAPKFLVLWYSCGSGSRSTGSYKKTGSGPIRFREHQWGEPAQQKFPWTRSKALCWKLLKLFTPKLTLKIGVKFNIKVKTVNQ